MIYVIINASTSSGEAIAPTTNRLTTAIKIKRTSVVRQSDGFCHDIKNGGESQSRGGLAIWKLSWWAIGHPTFLALCLSYAELTVTD